jgi:hypothetical protein
MSDPYQVFDEVQANLEVLDEAYARIMLRRGIFHGVVFGVALWILIVAGMILWQ